jgi:hypothetical protein
MRVASIGSIVVGGRLSTDLQLSLRKKFLIGKLGSARAIAKLVNPQAALRSAGRKRQAPARSNSRRRC